MTEEEKKAIKTVKEIKEDDLLDCWDFGVEEYKAIQTVLNLIEKQQKEIEELRKKLSLKRFDVNVVYNDYLEKLREFKSNSIPKSKIEEKIEELEAMSISEDIYYDDVLKMIKELLESEE